MKIMVFCQQAVVNLMAAKLRSFLAVLGILVGTAAVVALISCSQLATAKALAQFKALGTDLLSISVYPQSPNATQRNQEYLPIEFWRNLPQTFVSIKSIAPYAIAYQTMSYQGTLVNGAILGADESLAKTIRIDLASGSFVSFVDSYEHYCVIGDSIVQQFRQLSLEDPIGKPLRIGNTLYTIIGIAAPWKENGFFNEDINKSVIVPIAGIGLVSQDVKINNAVAILSPNSDVDALVLALTQRIHDEVPKLNVFIRSAKQLIASMESQGRIFTLLLGIIGGVALLVGGIGVMNVMLVSVSERKKEIGIRKAVGAKNKEIQALFLAESVLLSLSGGVLGVIVGSLFTWIVASVNGWAFSIDVLSLCAGFMVSMVTGLFFGFYPARRAALLDPIISLRSDV